MREIKFRSWHNNTLNGVYIMSPHEDIVKNCAAYLCDNKAFPKRTIMQFTGLKDKNGVDIYEGDIISAEKNCMFHDGRVNHVVEFLHDQFCVNGYSLFQSVNHFDAEVIGNKYESPELLEK